MEDGNEEIRRRLDQLIRQSGDSYAAVSRRIGRNAAYVQQFIRRGVPRRLSEQDRRRLAWHFGVSEQYLGAPGPETMPAGRPAAACMIQPDAAGHNVQESHSISVIVIPFLERVGSAGRADPPAAGGFVLEAGVGQRISDGRSASLGALVAQGDSMAPTISRGDYLLFDAMHRMADRDGLYVLQGPHAPMVRRIAIDPVDGTASILADNRDYPAQSGCAPDAIPVIGRILWIGKQIG